MTRRVYRSKISLFFVALVALLLPVQGAYLRHAWEDGSPPEIAMGTAVALLWILVIGTLNTRYWIESSVLHIRCSVLRWRIPIDSIIRITHGSGIGVGMKAALSLDMIEIWHRGGCIAISPKRRADFLSDLTRARAALGLEPVRGVRA